MDKNTKMPTIIVDLTDDTKTVEEAIAECEAARLQVKPWYKRIAKRIKRAGFKFIDIINLTLKGPLRRG